MDMKDWIADKDFRFNKVVYTQQKSRLGYDVYIEDSPYEALNIVKKNSICLLYDQPWNKSIKSDNLLVRVKNISEAKKAIEQKILKTDRNTHNLSYKNTLSADRPGGLWTT